MRDVVRAGAVLSLTGRFAPQGQQARRGLELWAAGDAPLPPSRGGEGAVRGKPVELVVYDDESRREPAARLTERLIVEDRVDLLFGPYSSVLTLAAAEVAECHGWLLWNHGGSTDAVAERGWRMVVNLLSPASRYFEGVLDFARSAAPAARTVALLYGARGTFPRAVIAGAEAHAARLGLEVVFAAPYPAIAPHPGPLALGAGRGEGDAAGGGAPPADATEPDPAGLVAEVARRRPDVILGVGTMEADLAFAREIRRQWIGAALVGLVATPMQRFREALGSAADGFCGPSQWEAASPGRPDLGPTSAQFATAFRGRFGAEPEYPAAQAYAAGLIAVHCAELAGTLDQEALRTVAAGLDLSTFYGRFRLDPETGQQVGHQLVVVQWKGGQKVVVWPPTPSE